MQWGHAGRTGNHCRGMVYATSVLCWALGGTSSGAVPRCDGCRDALGRNARVTAMRVRDSSGVSPGRRNDFAHSPFARCHH